MPAETATVRALVERVYAALAAGDRDALLAVLDPELDAHLADGMPDGLGGPRRGAEAMIDTGWWAIGRAYAVLAEPEEWIACADGRLLVRGRYRGRARDTGHVIDAAFDHLWTARDGRLTALRQLTDTARWRPRPTEETP
jgi:2-(1,2-epoxy-1,2-dihydrophenyl)acetyl-CoA isomerase